MITFTVERHCVFFGTVGSSSGATSPQTQPLKNVSQHIQRSVYTQSYEIQHTWESESTKLFFASVPTSEQQVVIKILKPYHDLRFSMSTIAERQQCQLEALVQNRRYSPDVYYGIARVIRTYQQTQYLGNEIIEKEKVELGEILENPHEGCLDEDAEYALVMRWLPKSRRLDYLLKKKPSAFLLRHMELLSTTIAVTHKANEQNISSNGILQWGSCAQLQKKLDHNLPFLERVLKVAEDERLSGYDNLKKTFAQIEKMMSRALQLKEVRSYFEKRVAQQKILRCHGDLKAANIWLLAAEGLHGEVVGERVKILDAIDFNASYCHIDILADMAMLAVDLEVRKSQEVAHHFINHYLHITQQEDIVARTVLTYYLVEKAMIGIIVSYVYDKQPDLGLKYAQVAQRYLTQLQRYERPFWYKFLVQETLRNVQAVAKRIFNNAKASAMSGVIGASHYFTRTSSSVPEPGLEAASASVLAICPEQTTQDV